MIKKIDHIGIAVKSIEKQIKFYAEILGLGTPAIEIVPDQKVKTAMFPVGEVRIELLEATSDDSPIAGFIEKRGEGIHHIAYLVDDLEKQLKELKMRNVRLVDEKPHPGTKGSSIAFLHPKSTFNVLIELCQGITQQ